MVSVEENKLLTTTTNILKQKKYLNKWLWYLMTNEEVELLNILQKKFSSINKYCNSNAGIVTGNNNFFILNSEQVNKYNLNNWVKPILKKSSFIQNSLIFSEDDFKLINDSNTPCYLLDLNNIDKDNIPVEIQTYLELGINLKIDQGYKCKVRNTWYKVPSILSTEGIFFKRVHLVPKLIKNKMDVLITDTGYRISMNDGYNINSLIFSFYNTLTLLFLELNGRSYGGGVLEITPNEFKDIIIPYVDVNEDEFVKLHNLMSKKELLDDVLQYTDELILKQNFGIDEETLIKLRNLREKLVTFRVIL